MQAQRAEGCEDLYGKRMRSWEAMCTHAARIFGSYGFEAIETPAMEQLQTFVHGIGESSDVVRKEMFRVVSGGNYARLLDEGSDSFMKAKQRLALRPEGTAGIVRAVVENNLVPQGAAPAKFYYALPMFRGERVQRGRLRQFHQIGIEWIGPSDPASDAETIIMLMDFYRALGISDEVLTLHINSMGDETCRPAYRELLKAYLHDHADQLTEDDLERVELNPMRLFDSKNPATQEVMAEAPLLCDHLSESCKSHFDQVCNYLDKAGIRYVHNPHLVRGLDYYTSTVFEVEANTGTGSQSAIGGGGRYDGLVELEGGRPTPAVGFAVGFERIMLVLEALGLELAPKQASSVYVACPDLEFRDRAFEVCLELRRSGIRVEADYQGRSLKAQLKQANKLEVPYTVFLGPDELSRSCALIRNMETHEQAEVELTELSSWLKERIS